MAKQQLQDAVGRHDVSQFLSLIHGHEKKHKSVDLEEVILELSQDDVSHLWDRLQAWADEQVTAFVSREEQGLAEAQGLGGETAEANTSNTPKGPAPEYNEKLLEGIVKFGIIYINTHKDSGTIFVPEKFLEMTLLMHEMMIVLDGAVKVAVVALCELWWLQDLETRDLIMSNTLVHLVEAAIVKGAQKKDVVRLWKIHDALATVDLSSPSKTDFVEMLTSTVSCPIFLRCDEGIKWLIKLFSWPSLIGPLHKEIRLAIPECTIAQSAKYGEIYFKAWKVSQGDTKKALEEDCIQDLMYTAIHANPMSCRPSANLHHLLHHIHSYKKQRAASTLITELYQPILWRSFSVANGYVRMNATGLLCDAFPLTDCTLTQEEQSDFLEKQYHTLKTMLLDPCHLVRITAIKGVFNILSKYWIMVPSEVIKAIFKILLTVLVYDVSTAGVRMAVVKGLTQLLNCVDAVPFLSQVLPQLGNVFDDCNVAVREAFAMLLLKVKESKALKYWDIVPVHHLLHRLELDNPKVAQRVTRLLLSSFHPHSKGDEALLQSSLSLLEENRMAARKFYQHASSMIGLPNVVHFILLLWICLANHIAIHKQQLHSDDEEGESNEDTSTSSGRRGKQHSFRGSQECERDSSIVSTSNKENAATAGRTGSNGPSIHRKDSGANKAPRGSIGSREGDDVEKESDEEEESENDEDNPLNNPEVLGGILDTVGILWATNAHRLAQPQNLKYLEALKTKISKNIHHFFRFFKGNSDGSRTLLYIASFLPKSMVPTLVGHCLSQLKTVQTDQVVSGEDTSYKNYINALCNWNRTDSVLELVNEWLEEGFRSVLSGSSKEKRRSRRRVRFCETSTPKPLVGLYILLHILEHPLNRVATLQRYRPQLLEMIQDMAKVKDMISDRLQQSEELSTLCSDKFLCECWSLYLRLVVVSHHCPSQTRAGMQVVASTEETEDLYLDGPACISECLEWASSALVPYLGERSGGKRRLQDTEETSTLITSTLKSLATSSTHLLMIGAAKVPFVYMLNGFVKILLETDKEGRFWEESLFLAHEGYEFLWVYESNEEEKEESVITPVQLASTCIASMSEYFKHHDQLPKEWKELSNTLVEFLLRLGQRSRQNQSQVLQHLMACVVEHLSWRASNDNGEEMEVERVQQLGGFVALLVGAFQNQTKLSIAVMDAFTQFLTADIHDIKSLVAACHLLKVLLHDSGKISRYSLKQAVIAANSAMSAVVLPQTEGEETGQESAPSGYEQAAKKVREILDDLKNSLGIV